MDRHVIVICEECGRKYRVDPDRILGRAAGFNCRSCGHSIRVAKPEPFRPSDLPAPAAPPPAESEPSADEAEPVAEGPQPPFRSAGLSLRAKAWLAWFLVPGVPLAGATVVLFDPLGVVPSLGEADVRLILQLLAGGLIVVLMLGLGFGLRLIDRISRLSAAAERAVCGSEETLPAPDSGDDLERVAAAVRVLGRRLRSQRGQLPVNRGKE